MRELGESLPSADREGKPGVASPSSTPPTLEWIIIGGGIHGSYLSNFLSCALGYTREQLVVIDPHEEPIHRWKQNTANVGMEYLRSAAVHHIDLPSLSLKRFAARMDRGSPAPFLPPYGRPLLSLFNSHADATLHARGLEGLRVQGRVERLERVDGGYLVTFIDGSRSRFLRARRVLAAIGMNDQTCWPEWALRIRKRGALIRHVLDPDFRRPHRADWRSALVYGGGQSGVQLALALAALKPGSVTLLSGHEIGTHLFDSEPSWQGVNFMRSFAAERDPKRRRLIIARERHRGSVSPEARAQLDRAIAGGVIRFLEVDPKRNRASISSGAAGFREVTLGTSAGEVRGDYVVLATGYDQSRPGGAWLERAVQELDLPCAPCGFPLVDPSLAWAPGLYVSGALAELEIGPVSRNISGAHRCAARLEYFVSPATPPLST